MNKVLITEEQLGDISDVELDIPSGGPDYWCDGYILSGVIKCPSTHPTAFEGYHKDGYYRDLTDEELDYIQDNYSDWVYEQMERQVY